MTPKISPQLAYYYRKGKAIRKAKLNALHTSKHKATNQHKVTTIPHIPSPTLKLRLHRFQRNYKILNAVSEAKLRSLKLNRLNNTNQYLGAGFRITSQSLELEGVELISDSRLPVAVLEGLAVSLADNVATSLSLQYSLKISKEGQTPPKLTEIELSATQLTEKMEHKGLIELYCDAQGYKVWVDWSFGLGGLESNKGLYIQKLTTFANDLVVNDMWELMKQRQEGMEKLMLAYGHQLNKHIPILKLAEKLLAESPSKHTRMAKAYVDDNQRRLL